MSGWRPWNCQTGKGWRSSYTNRNSTLWGSYSFICSCFYMQAFMYTTLIPVQFIVYKLNSICWQQSYTKTIIIIIVILICIHADYWLCISLLQANNLSLNALYNLVEHACWRNSYWHCNCFQCSHAARAVVQSALHILKWFVGPRMLPLWAHDIQVCPTLRKYLCL